MSSKLHVSHFCFWIKLANDEYLLLNPCYGTMAFVDEDVVAFLSDFLEGQEKNLPNSKVIEELVENDILTKRTKEEEIDFAKNLKNTFYYRTGFVKHSFIITYNCNMRCIYCYESGLWKRSRKWLEQVISEEQVDKIYEIIENLRGSNERVRSISLYGGEPLMLENMDIVEYILKKGHEKAYSFDTNTNGITIKDYVDLFKKYGLNQISVTLDGPKDIHDKRRIKQDGSGSFDRIVEGIDIATERGVFIAVRVNVDSTNIEKLPELANFIRQKGWHEKKNLSFGICRVAQSIYHEPHYVLSWNELIKRVVRLREDHAEMEVFQCEWDEGQMNSLSAVFEHGCPPPRDIFCLAHSAPVLIYDPHGNVYVCAKLIGEEEHKVGTYTTGLKFNENYKLWRNRKVLNIEECKECRYSLMCGGGCAYDALIRHKTIMKPYCDEFMATIKWYAPHIYNRNFKSCMLTSKDNI